MEADNDVVVIEERDVVMVEEQDAVLISLEVSPTPSPPPAPPAPTSSTPSVKTEKGMEPEMVLHLQRLKAISDAKEMERAREYARVKALAEMQNYNQKFGKYPAKIHAQKVAKELKVRCGIIYLPGQVETNFEDSDQGYEFRQRRYFFYLSGADFPGCAVTYDISQDSLILWIPQSDPKNILWFGRTPTADQVKELSMVDDVRPIPALDGYLRGVLRSMPTTTLYVLHNTQVPRLDGAHFGYDATVLKAAMDNARVIKTGFEIAMIRKANAISSLGHHAVLCRLKRLNSEREVESIFRGYCIAQGAKRQAYPVIAASGRNAATLHYSANDEHLGGKQLMCLDAGAEWTCYASDVTRTFPLSGKFSTEAAQIYNIVDRMQKECIARVRPGILFSALHLHACIIAVQELMKLGILRGSQHEIFRTGTVAAFFPHGLGHHVGLEVHDVSGSGNLLFGQNETVRPRTRGPGGKRESVSAVAVRDLFRDTFRPTAESMAGNKLRPLERHMVITIEPGIYFCKEYIEAYYLSFPEHRRFIDESVLEKYYDVGGVRIEDCILVTDTGFENLTSAPKGEEMLKIINAGLPAGM
ncbi:peptidase M24, structural domain-containing protein [Echria macrotheca]|uniref:Xaa-Pro aminopeptidase n=1 Tax=Echria macrotheca TaxID=438768 RepID=A0AAJ0B329_9PEZI|nr:peptidase M24, structural domain-containing protein [Echria macrotheca]